MNRTILEYLDKKSWRINENANVSYSYSGLLAYTANRMLANYSLSHMPVEAAKAHIRGDLHIHNLEGGQLIPYCHGGDLLKLLLKGINAGNIGAKPAKHLSAAVDHIVNYFFMSQLEFSGAQSFSDFDTLLAPFVHYDGLNYEEVKQNIQRLIFNLNFACRQAYQTPFTNLTFNLLCPKSLQGTPVVVGGETKEDKYEDFNDESLMINKAFCEVIMGRDAAGNPFTFPIPTINITKQFPWNDEVVDYIFAEVSVMGSYYFMNYVGSGIDENSIRAMCCRLNIDLSQLSSPRGLWNMTGGTGSIGVVSINMARLGYLSKNDDQLYERLDRLMEIGKEQLEHKRKTIKASYENSLLPFTKFYGLELGNYFSTIGVIGLNEMCINYLHQPIYEATSFVEKILGRMRDVTRQFQEKTGHLYNLEMTPGEGSSYRLAYKDRKKYKKICTMGTKKRPYYTTLLIPPKYDINVFDRLKIEEKILPIFTGGTVFRMFIGDHSVNFRTLINLSKKIVCDSRIPYFDITCTFSICQEEGTYLPGHHAKCPNCNGDTEVYSRVVGYYRPKSRWNIGKQQEFDDRKYIIVS